MAGQFKDRRRGSCNRSRNRQRKRSGKRRSKRRATGSMKGQSKRPFKRSPKRHLKRPAKGCSKHRLKRPLERRGEGCLGDGRGVEEEVEDSELRIQHLGPEMSLRPICLFRQICRTAKQPRTRLTAVRPSAVLPTSTCHDAYRVPRTPRLLCRRGGVEAYNVPVKCQDLTPVLPIRES